MLSPCLVWQMYDIVHLQMCYVKCCGRKAWAACVQSFALWQQATKEIMRRNHSPRTLVIIFNRSQVSIGRDSTPQSLYYCLFVPHIHGCCSSCTSRSWWIAHSTQRYLRGCNNIPTFLQRTAPIAHSFCEGFTQHYLHILVTAPFCCDRKAQAACAQSFTLWQQATIKIMRRNQSLRALIIMFSRSQVTIGRDSMPQSLYYCLFGPHIYGCCSSCTFHSWWIAHSTQR